MTTKTPRRIKTYIRYMRNFSPRRRDLRGIRKMHLEEVDIPTWLKKFDIDLSDICDPVRPALSTGGIISQDMATDDNSNPVSKPCVHIDYSATPFAPSIVEQGNALSTSKNQTHRYNSTRPLSMQHYTMYRFRFIMDAALCNAFGRLGNTISQ